MQVLQWITCIPTVPSIWEDVHWMWKDRPLQKMCRSKRDHTVYELQVKLVQDSQDEEIEIVSINSIYLNKNWPLITVHIELQVGKNTVEIPYKIDTGSKCYVRQYGY